MLRGVPEPAANQLLDRVHSERAMELRRLLAAPPDTAGALMSTDSHVARPDDSLEKIRAELAANPPRIDYLALPVVDLDGRLVGAIAVDDVIKKLVAERLPGRRRFHHGVGRDRPGAAR